MLENFVNKIAGFYGLGLVLVVVVLVVGELQMLPRDENARER